MILALAGIVEDSICFREGLESSLCLRMQADKIFPETSQVDGESFQQIEMDESYLNQRDSLRFEVRD